MSFFRILRLFVFIFREGGGGGGGVGEWGRGIFNLDFFSRPYTTDMYRQYAPCPYNHSKLK